MSSQGVNASQVDELIEALLQKENRDFDSFCAVLEKHSYNAMGERLKEAGTLPIIAVLHSRCARPQSEVAICIDIVCLCYMSCSESAWDVCIALVLRLHELK